VSARDKIDKTRKGLSKSSSGTVTYSANHRLKIELDVEMLCQICGDDVPGGGHSWTPRRLEWVFKERTGRPGSWNHYEVGIIAFLKLFPKTFELFKGNEFVRLRRPGKGHVLDHVEDVMTKLAQASVAKSLGPKALPADHVGVALPELSKHRIKATYVPYDPGFYGDAGGAPQEADADGDQYSNRTINSTR
jgi:hypothetical protein